MTTSKFQPKTFPDFVQRMASRIVARTDLNDLEDGGVLLTIIGALARELDDLHYQMVRLQDVFDIDTATGADLDARAKDYNPDAIVRSSAVKASGKVKFYRVGTTGNIAIPEGVIVGVPGEDSQQYRTTIATTIADGGTSSAEVLVVATVAGSSANFSGAGYLDPVVLAGSVDLTADDVANGPTGVSQIISAVAGLDSVRNTTGMSSGSDTETDSSFRGRIKTYLRSLSRATPHSLEDAVLGVKLDNFGRIQVAKVQELQEPNLGKVLLYVDDGTGSSAKVQAHNYETDPVTNQATGFLAEALTENAAGGEIYFQLKHAPLVGEDTAFVTWVTQTALAGGPAVNTSVTLTRGSAVSAAGTYDYRLNQGSGKLTLYPGGPNGIATVATSPSDVKGLQALDTVHIRYKWYGGLIEEAQKIVDGDASDRPNYPGVRAAGVDVRVLPPTILSQTVEATINIDPGHESSGVVAECKTAIMNYINGLPINGDIYITELIYVLQGVSGVRDVIWTSGGDPYNPTNTIVGEGELARVALEDIILTGT
jgi:uncharacterized phage protein gp47/JayE